MFIYKGHAIQTHDLLHINPECLLDEAASQSDRIPGWAEESLRAVPFAVVRRDLISATWLPIGVRGPERNQRWAASCSPRAILHVMAPCQLLGRIVLSSRVESVPALQCLEILQARWKDLDFPWGPGGSVGFELATGMTAANPGSDLDIVIRATQPIMIQRAKLLCEQTTDLPATVDIRVETPVCGFSLKEYVRGSRHAILLHTPNGPVLGSDPWHNGPHILDVADNLERADF